ncbi:MAG: 50S ribosomal protein L17 [Spirochaetales bacterium]|nr:50S ribosomal protein L17 [Spirochaetales bacterium]
MNNKTGFNRLNRRAGQRRALLKNMVTSLFQYERITTTKAKALEVRRFAEKMVTRAKVDSVHNRREVSKTITNETVLRKLFTVLGPRFQSRMGGYTRILKIGQRYGDAAEMVLLEFVERSGQTAAPEAPTTSNKKSSSEETKKASSAEAAQSSKPKKATKAKEKVPAETK